jgi:hypothetical protein
MPDKMRGAFDYLFKPFDPARLLEITPSGAEP